MYIVAYIWINKLQVCVIFLKYLSTCIFSCGGRNTIGASCFHHPETTFLTLKQGFPVALFPLMISLPAIEINLVCHRRYKEEKSFSCHHPCSLPEFGFTFLPWEALDDFCTSVESRLPCKPVILQERRAPWPDRKLSPCNTAFSTLFFHKMLPLWVWQPNLSSQARELEETVKESIICLNIGCYCRPKSPARTHTTHSLCKGKPLNTTATQNRPKQGGSSVLDYERLVTGLSILKISLLISQFLFPWWFYTHYRPSSFHTARHRLTKQNHFNNFRFIREALDSFTKHIFMHTLYLGMYIMKKIKYLTLYSIFYHELNEVDDIPDFHSPTVLLSLTR